MNLPPGATTSVHEILQYVRQERHLDLKNAAVYIGLSELLARI
jgi:hypothetical protein